MPTKYIHEPWLAPIALQKASNCIIGEDYPERLCDHKERRKVCLERLKEVCQQITGTQSSYQESAYVEWKSVLNIQTSLSWDKVWLKGSNLIKISSCKYCRIQAVVEDWSYSNLACILGRSEVTLTVCQCGGLKVCLWLKRWCCHMVCR